MGASQRAERENPAIIKNDQWLEQEVRVAAGKIFVEMHVTDWAAAQKKDPELDAVLQWLGSRKRADLRTLLRECIMSEEGQMVWRNHQTFTSLQGTLYLCSTPKGENEDLLLFVVPRAQQTAALNGCYWDASHQGQDHTLSLWKECFWWPGMAKQMRQVIKACGCCLQYEGSTLKAPLCPIVATAPLDLLHVGFTSIETTMELDKSPWVTNVLVFQDHFTKHVLAYVIPDQTAKTIAKFLYGGYIPIFGAPARLLSDRGTSFTSSIIEELCKILGIQWLWTMPYHPQTIGLVERSHQTILCIIGKLGEDKKADWPSHLAEIAHAYNATWSAVTGYSPHYLMFGWWPRLLVNFIFPTIGSSEAPLREASARRVDTYVASVRDQLRSTLREAQAQLTSEAHLQKQYYDRKIGAVNLKLGDLVLIKVDAWKEKRKIKDRWVEETWEVSWQIAADVPSYEVMNQHRQSRVLHQNWLLLIASEVGVPLCMGSHHTWDRCTSPTPCKTTSSGGDEERRPQEQDCKAVTWWPTSKASLGWKNRKLQLRLWTSTGVSTEDGWRPQVKWFGCRPPEEDICKAEGQHLYPLMLADSEPKEECCHLLNWVTAGKANQTEGEVKWESRPVLGWRVKGLPLQCEMLLPTFERYLHQLWRDGFIPFKAAKQKWQPKRKDRAWGHALSKNWGVTHRPPSSDYQYR